MTCRVARSGLVGVGPVVAIVGHDLVKVSSDRLCLRHAVHPIPAFDFLSRYAQDRLRNCHAGLQFWPAAVSVAKLFGTRSPTSGGS